MTYEGIISTLTVIASLAVKIIGAPSQIRQIVKTNSSESVSLLQWVLVFTSYVLWLLHGIIKKDVTVIIGQGIGIITSGLIMIFILKYRKRNA